MRSSLRSVLLVLGLAGCGSDAVPEPCVTTQVLDAGICQVLDSGLVLHRVGDELWVSQLHDDGDLELRFVLDSTAPCERVVAHDPATETLWWIEGLPEELARLVQLDMATDTINWQRELVFDGRELEGWIDLRFHDGALYVGGTSYSDPEAIYTDNRSLLARIDGAGQTVWTHVGYPGFGFSPEGAGEPLNGLGSLVGTNSGISFIGQVFGIDSQALTLATVDAQTGELLWSSSLNRDNYYGDINRVTTDGERLYSLAGTSGHPARTTLTAITPLGEAQWQADEYAWSSFTYANFGHAAVGGSIFTAAVQADDAPLARIARWSAAGSLECEAELPEVAAAETAVVELSVVGDQLVLKARGDDSETEFFLVKPGE